MNDHVQKSTPGAVAKPWVWISIFLSELAGCLLAGVSAGVWSFQHSILLMASLGFGIVFGLFSAFLFTSSGKEEEATFGKIRDWMLAGITGVGAAELMEGGGSVRRLLLVFSQGNETGDFALVLTAVTLGFASGFFFMFVQRELHLNPLLAKSRALTASVESAKSASNAVHELLNKLPVSLLTSVNDVSDAGLSPGERKDLKDLLTSPEVKEFLDKMTESVNAGATLDWDRVSKTALIQYYKTYFEPVDKRKSQIHEAEAWIQRALLMQPNHGAMTIAYADLKSLEKDFASAVRMLKELIIGGDPPATALQLLGYYLLESNRDLESIQYTQMYLQLYPDDSITIFNLAFAYGRLYCADSARADLRKQCLEQLARGLALDPTHVTRIRDSWYADGLECFRSDAEFTALLDRAAVYLEGKPDAKHEATPHAEDNRTRTAETHPAG